MNKTFKTLGAVSAVAFGLAAVAQATSYTGNGATGFGGPFGNGILTLTSSGGTVNGTIAAGANPTLPGQLYDEVVIYIDSVAGGLTSTSTITAATQANGNPDFLQQAAAGTNGVVRAPLNFAPGFGADYAIALSPVQADYGVVYQITSTGALNFLQSISLAPTGSPGPYTFNFSLANIGSPTSFKFSTTYINGHIDSNGNEAYRSNEAIGNTITDVTTPTNTNNPGQDTALVGFVTFAVPEPGTWAMMLGGLSLLAAFVIRRQNA